MFNSDVRRFGASDFDLFSKTSTCTPLLIDINLKGTISIPVRGK